MKKRLIIACSGSKHLGKAIAKKSKSQYAEIKSEVFPDSELKIKIPDVKNKEVYFIQSFYPDKSNINDKIIEILFAAQTAKKNGAKKLFLIAPYMPYLREDKRFEKGESISAEIMAKLFGFFNKVYVVEPHLHRFKKLKNFFPNAKKISLTEGISDYIKNNIKKQCILLGPDQESEQWVKPIAKQLNTKYYILNKKRLHSRKVVIKGKKILHDNVIIIDDIISTGHTLIEASKLIKAKKIYFIAAHGIFSEDALRKLNKKGKVIVSNTIPSSKAKIDISTLISKIIKK